MLTNAIVCRPAIRARHCRSTPIAMPSRVASPTRTSNSKPGRVMAEIFPQPPPQARGTRSGEHEIPHEPRHAAQVCRLADVQDVVAGEPVQRAPIPVVPEHLRLFGWGEAVTEAGDDEPAVAADQRLVVQR